MEEIGRRSDACDVMKWDTVEGAETRFIVDQYGEDILLLTPFTLIVVIAIEFIIILPQQVSDQAWSISDSQDCITFDQPLQACRSPPSSLPNIPLLIASCSNHICSSQH